MKKLVLVGLAAAALAVPATGSAATTTVKCSYNGSAVGNLRATGVSCAVARKVVRADLQGKRYGSFKCVGTPYEGGANVTCKSGKKRVRFQIAD
jgi:hypothetical protein